MESGRPVGEFGTVTRLAFRDSDATEEAADGLRGLLEEVAEREEFSAGHLLRVADDELILVTIYASEGAAESLSAELRPRLAEVIGPLVEGPPDRAAGKVVVTAGL
jgi:hypothetical protein